MLFENENEKMLIVAPHPDDESIGAGGLLTLYGPKCDVLLLTTGQHGHHGGLSEPEVTKIRKKEISAAINLAKVNKLFTLEIEDTRLYQNKKTVYSFDVKNYKYIFVPNRFERNLDHMAVYPILRRMIMLQKSKATLVEYEVWTPLRKPNLFIDITAVIDNKRRMISEHKSQIVDCDFANAGIGLSAYRGMFANCEYAEAFFVCKSPLKDFFKLNESSVLLFARNRKRMLKKKNK